MNSLHKFNFVALAALATCLTLSTSFAARDSFPNAATNVRTDTPDDPRFDCNEPDDEDGDDASCPALFDQQVNLLGFAPSSTAESATYKDQPRLGQGQISGVRADRAWKTTTGRPDTLIVVMDTGVNWYRHNLLPKLFINKGELPLPEGSAVYDKNGDGVFNSLDYNGDSRVGDRNGLHGANIDPQDLIIAFSDGIDDDGNGYIDDISGWDFFEDDNDANDTTSYSSARNHGSGRMTEAAQTTNDGDGEAGVCPECMILPTRVWDTFVSPGDSWAAATTYAADMGADVQIVALGMLQNSRSAKAANTYAHNKGMSLMQVSSDLNTANHNYPTNYVESVYINGCAADVHGLSSEFPNAGDFLPSELQGGNVPLQTWFRNSNLTQYGAHAHVCYTAVTGSEATGHAGGGAGLIVSAGRDYAAQNGGELTAYEVKQLMTLTAEDVLPENTVGAGEADPANPGWDEYFGYGRANLGAAVEAVRDGNIPNSVQINDPAWWAIIDPTKQEWLEIDAYVSGRNPNFFEDCSFELQWAKGVSPLDEDFASQSGGSCQHNLDGTRFTPRMSLGNPNFEIPEAVNGTPNPDPNAYAFTVRLIVRDNKTGAYGEDRKVYFLHHDPTWHEGWPKFVDTGGETSPTLYDLNGDGTLEYFDANSSGELWVYNHDGSNYQGFNNGQPFIAPPSYFYHPDAPGFKSGAVPPPTGGSRSIAIADVDNDLLPEVIFAVADGRIYVLDDQGNIQYQVGVDPELSTPDKRTSRIHPKRGFLGSPSIADLDGDGVKEIIIAALDEHVYVWRGTDGQARDGFPVQVFDPSGTPDARGELIATVGIADLDNNGRLEIITGSSEYFSAEPSPPDSPPDLQAGFGAIVNAIIENSAGGTGRLYAIQDDGTIMDNWPVSMAALLGTVLPFVGPQHAPAVGDVDNDGIDEVVASMTTSDLHIFEADGSSRTLATNGVVQGGADSESSRILNLFEYPVIGDLNGRGGLDIAKVGLTAGGAVNLLLVGQNLPFNHVVQAWDAQVTESYLPGYPIATDDYQLLSSPAIADADGDGQNDIISGSGLYLIHAYNQLGQDVEGFPKLTGGWVYNVPAINDIDDDGKLEMVAGTREGYRFIWDLEADATLENTNQWSMEAHDECHTNRYGTDCRPPARIKDLNYDETSDTVSMVIPGDDWNIGQLSQIKVRTASTPFEDFNDWQAAVALTPIDVTDAPRSTIEFEVPQGTGNYLAFVPVDDAGNKNTFASIQVRQEVVEPPPPPPQPHKVYTPAVMNSAGFAGNTVNAGRFIVDNTQHQNHSLRGLQLNIDNPNYLESITVSALSGETVTVNNVQAITDIEFPQNINIADRSEMRFSLSAKLINQEQWRSLNTTAAWGQAAYASNGNTIPTTQWLVMLICLALLCAFKLFPRKLWIALTVITLMTACSRTSDSHEQETRVLDGEEPTISYADQTIRIYLRDLQVEDADGAVRYPGMPTQLSRITAKYQRQ